MDRKEDRSGKRCGVNKKARGPCRGPSLSYVCQALGLKLPEQIVRAGDLKAAALLDNPYAVEAGFA